MAASPAEFNRAIIDEFHANEGRVGGPFEGSPLLLLHHTGAKSGQIRISPLGFLSDAGRYVVCASNGGATRHPDWYYNLRGGVATIEVGTEIIPVHASEASGEERDRLFCASAERAPQLREYEKQAGRTIPVIVLTPTEAR